MKVAKADITLTWNDGRTVHIGTLDIEADKTGFKTTGRFRQRLGWELVRKGFHIMFPSKNGKQNTTANRAKGA